MKKVKIETRGWSQYPEMGRAFVHRRLRTGVDSILGDPDSVERNQQTQKHSVRLVGITIHTAYVVWQKNNETDFLLTINFFFLQIKVIPFKIVPLGSYTATETLFPLFVAVLEGFCWCTFQLVGYTLLDIIQSIKMAPFQAVFELEE
jgi:hypothetical protein